MIDEENEDAAFGPTRPVGYEAKVITFVKKVDGDGNVLIVPYVDGEYVSIVLTEALFLEFLADGFIKNQFDVAQDANGWISGNFRASQFLAPNGYLAGIPGEDENFAPLSKESLVFFRENGSQSISFQGTPTDFLIGSSLGAIKFTSQTQATQAPVSDNDVVRLIDLSAASDTRAADPINIYNNSNYADLTDFTVVGFTPTLSTDGSITLPGGSSDLSQYMTLNGLTNADENLDITVKFVILSKSGKSLSVGRKSINPFADQTISGSYNFTTNVVNFDQFSIPIASQFVPAVNDICTLTYSFRPDRMTVTFTDITQNYSVSTSAFGNQNTGDPVIYNGGSSVSIKNIDIKSYSNPTPDILAIGDSKTLLPTPVYNGNRYSTYLKQFGIVNVFAGNSDDTREVLAQLPYLLGFFKPKQWLLNIGRNNIANGNYPYIDDYTSITSQLEAVAPVVHLLPIPENTPAAGTVDQTALYTWIDGFATRKVATTSFNPVTMTFDNVHPNDIGAKVLAGLIANSGYFDLSDRAQSDNVVSNFSNYARKDAANVFELIQTLAGIRLPGTTAQYIRGDGTAATFPTTTSAFTNNSNFSVTTAPETFQGAKTLTNTLTINGNISTAQLIQNSTTGNLVYGLRSLPTITPNANNAIVFGAQFGPNVTTGTGALTATITTQPTSPPADGTYDNLASTTLSGGGSGQTWRVVIAGGIVTSITPATAATGGSGYTVGSTFSVATITGGVFTVATLGYTGVRMIPLRISNGPIEFQGTGTPNNTQNGDVWHANDNTGHKFRSNGVTYSIGSTTILGATTATTGAFSGVLTAPTAAAGTNTTQVATTAFVQAASLSATLEKSANYTVLLTDFNAGILHLYVDASAGVVTITLPSAATMGASNRTYQLYVYKKDSSGNGVVLTGSANINGAATYTVTPQYESILITSNATQYYAR